MDDNKNDVLPDFIQLKNVINNQVEAVMCKTCNQILRPFDEDILESHKYSCFVKKVDETNKEILTKDDVDKLLVKFFVSSNIPFAVVDNIHFINFVSGLRKIGFNFKLPCRRTLSTSLINNYYQEITEKKKKFLEKTDTVLLIDGWRSKMSNCKFLACTIRNVKTPPAFLLLKDAPLETDDEKMLIEFIENAVAVANEKYSSNIFAIVSNSKVVLGEQSVKLNDISLWQSKCLNHHSKLFLQNIADKTFVDNVKNIIKVFKEPALHTFLVKQGGTKLEDIPVKKFYFLLNSCQNVLENLEIMKQISMIEHISIEENIKTILNNYSFKQQLIDTIVQLNPVCDLIKKCQEPSSSIADATEMWLRLTCVTSFDYDLLCAKISEVVLPVGLAANLIHPQYLGLLLNENQKTKALSFFINNCDVETLQELNTFLNDKSKVMILMQKCKDPYVFWRLSHLHFPKLSKIAQKLFLIPASIIPLEKIFSSWTWVQNTNRNRLEIEKSQKVLEIFFFLKHNQPQENNNM